MRIALIDPSLFTLPYDAALASGLCDIGQQVKLHGRPARPEDGAAADFPVEPSFYRASASPIARCLPKPARLAFKGLDHLACMLRLRLRLHAEPPDAIHFQWLPLPVMDRYLIDGFSRIAPTVLTVHDTDPFNGSPAARVQRMGFASLLAGFDELIVHTQQGVARLAAMGLARDRITRLPHGRLALAAPDASADPMQDPVTFVLFGKIKPYKGADLLLAAFAAIPPGIRDSARVRIVGQAYMDIAALRAQAGDLGIAGCIDIEQRFVPDEELGTIFHAGTVAMFPYREIEASGVLSLALAHGRPIIASRIGNFAESIEDDVHGRLVPVGDVAALSAAMQDVLEDRIRTAGYAARVRSLEASQPGWDEIARQTLGVYARAANRRNAECRRLETIGEAA